MLGNLKTKTMINGAHKAFKFSKYASHDLGAFGYRFQWPLQPARAFLGLIGHAAKLRGT